jgi:capsular exopolysaccharide synthesis family protein
VSLVGELEQPVDATRPPAVTARVVQPARTPVSPSWPDASLNILLSVMIGLLAGVAAALYVDARKQTIRTADRLEQVTGAAALGVVRESTQDGPAESFCARAPGSAFAEQMRIIRNNLAFVREDSAATTLMITSAVKGEGKSTVASNLAEVMAQAGQRVVLVEADLRNPTLADAVGLDGSVGLSTVLSGGTPVGEAVQDLPGSDVRVLTAGGRPPNPGEIVGSRRMTQVLRELASTFDHVIVDAPPLLSVADGSALAPLVDGCVVIVRCGETSETAVGEALKVLRGVRADLLGLVLARSEATRTSLYGGLLDDAEKPQIGETPESVPSSAGGPVSDQQEGTARTEDDRSSNGYVPMQLRPGPRE